MVHETGREQKAGPRQETRGLLAWKEESTNQLQECEKVSGEASAGFVPPGRLPWLTPRAWRPRKQVGAGLVGGPGTGPGAGAGREWKRWKGKQRGFCAACLWIPTLWAFWAPAGTWVRLFCLCPGSCLALAYLTIT